MAEGWVIMKRKTPALEKGQEQGQVEFSCPKCGRFLAWALPSAEMKCPQCGKWVTGKNRKHHEPDLQLSLEDDQFLLF